MAKEYHIEVEGTSDEHYQKLNANVSAEDNTAVMALIEPIVVENLEVFGAAKEIKIKITVKSDPVAFREGLKKYQKPPAPVEEDLSAACDPLSHNADVMASGKCSNCGQANVL